VEGPPHSWVQFRERVGPKLIYVGDQFQVNWTVAASECTYMGGYLATFKDQEDIDFIN